MAQNAAASCKDSPLKHSAKFAAFVLSLAAIGWSEATVAEQILGATQQVMRLNPKRDPGKPAYTVADCFHSEHCLSSLTQTVVQAGGNAGLLAGIIQEPEPRVTGDESVYRFEAPEGESFCKAVLLKLSVAPNFGASAPELKFSASRRAI